MLDSGIVWVESTRVARILAHCARHLYPPAGGGETRFPHRGDVSRTAFEGHFKREVSKSVSGRTHASNAQRAAHMAGSDVNGFDHQVGVRGRNARRHNVVDGGASGCNGSKRPVESRLRIGAFHDGDARG